MQKKMKDSALVVVDMLYDFIDGSMACQGAEGAIEGTLKAIDGLTAGTDTDETNVRSTYPILFIRDHHPADHCSFVEQGGPWPPHCVQGTRGADVHESLLPYVKEDLTFFKGEDPAKEQYSGFEGVNPAGQSLGEVLKLLDVKNVLVCGIATEYCVRNTAEDLARDGFEVYVIQDALAWVDAAGHAEALKAMDAEGIHLI
jgi:nicotinamidase-related amidase